MAEPVMPPPGLESRGGEDPDWDQVVLGEPLPARPVPEDRGPSGCDGVSCGAD